MTIQVRTQAIASTWYSSIIELLLLYKIKKWIYLKAKVRCEVKNKLNTYLTTSSRADQ